MALVVALKRDSAVDPRRHLIDVQKELRSQVAKLKQDANGARASNALLKMFDDYDLDAGHDPDKAAQCQRAVDLRLNRMNRTRRVLEAKQQRDLLIIIMFGAGKISNDSRLRACAILKLGGTDQAVGLVCETFPRFRQAFEA